MVSRQAEFRRRAAEAMANPRLRENLARFGRAYRGARAEALSVLDYDRARDQLRRMKEDAVERLPELTAQFIEAVHRVGATVVEVKTAAEACDYIARLARARQVELVVKSKSMVSEEIELNHYLQNHGITALEADLGEWIIQQAGELPSHSVMPCIHLSKEEVAEIFSKALGRRVDPDIQAMVQTARAELREKFLTAGMGLSGANIAVAETGTVIIVTNEGNGRLVTTLPPIHVALLGYDKLIPTMDDAASQLNILAKAATAQGLTVYTTFITGKTGVSAVPRPPGFRGPTAPEVHIVLLDNGRLAMRDDAEFREALYCIRCASCANVCPTYRVVGGHVFGHIYTAVIGTVITPFHHGWEHAAVPQEACLLCNACYDACPAKINLPRMIVAMRDRLAAQEAARGEAGGLRHFFLTRVLPRPTLLHASLRVAGVVQGLLTGGRRVIRNLPGPLRRFTSMRAVPTLALRPLRSRLPAVTRPPAPPRARVAFFASCLIDHLYPEIGEAVVKVLRHYGCEVHFPRAQSCCGLPASYEGQKGAAAEMARNVIRAFEKLPVDYIVVASPPCGIALRQYVPQLTQGDPAWAERARALADRTRDFSEFLVRVLEVNESIGATGGPPIPLAYHDSCSAYRGLKLRDPQRHLIGLLRRYELREIDEIGECCGFGGHFSTDYPEVAGEVLHCKIAVIERTGAAVVALDSPGCLLQIRGGIIKRGSPITVKHLAELLAEAIDDRTGSARGHESAGGLLSSVRGRLSLLGFRP
ncbi:MAG: L-lactate dehydrogenase (quinone) large subunit LdhH [Candidatus Methylomirabilales bacterium]